MATSAKLEISVTQKGILSAQKSLDRLKASAQKASTTMKKFGTTMKNGANKSLTGLEAGVKKFSGFLNGEGSSAVSKMAGRIGKLVKSFGGMKAAIIAVIALQLARWLKVVASAAIEFNSAIANIGTLIPEQITKTRAYAETIQNVAITYGKSQKDIADATYQTISAFGDLSNTFEIVDIAAQASTAGLASTADAVNLLSTVSKGYNDTSTDTIQKISDLAFTTVRLGQTTFPELASSMGAVTPLANALGISMEELFAVGATLTGVTGNTSEVYTQLASVLTATVKPTTQLREVMGGLSGKEFIAEAGGLAGALDLIKTASEESGNELASYLGRKEGLIATLALTGAQTDTYAAKLKELSNVSGATGKALLEQTEGVNRYGHNLKQLKTNFDTLKTGIGDFILPFVSFIADYATPFIDILKSVFKALTGIARLAEAVMRPLNAMFSAPLKIVAALVKLLIGGLGSAFTYVADIINGVITLFKGEFAKTFKDIKTVVVDLIDSFTVGFPEAMDASEVAIAIFTGVMTALGVYLKLIVAEFKIFATLLKAQGAIIVTVAKTIKNAFTGNFAAIKQDSKKLVASLKGSFGSIKDTVTETGKDIKSSMSTSLEAVAKKAENVAARIAASRMGQVVIAPLAGAESYNAIEEQFNNQISAITSNVKLYADLGRSYDATTEKSNAYKKALDQMLASGDIHPSLIKRFIKWYAKLETTTVSTKKSFGTMRAEFIKNVGVIDNLQKTYNGLGIEYDGVDEKSKLFNKTLKALAESGLVTTEQMQSFSDEFGILNNNLDDTKTKFEEAKEAAKEFSDVLQESVFNALIDISAFAPDMALALSGLIASLTSTGIDSTVTAFQEIGTAMSDGAVSGDEFKDALVGQLQAILDVLPTLFIQAGLQLIASDPKANLGIGLGFIASGLTSAFVSGLTGGLTDDSSSTTTNAHGNAFDSGIVPFKTGGAFTNTIVDTPTTFKFAQGTGLMGEAGAEAIVPLTRTASGDLGVKSTGGGNIVNINVINQNGSNVDVQQSEDENGNIDIEVLVQSAVNKGFNTGAFDGAITSRYNTKQKGVG